MGQERKQLKKDIVLAEDAIRNGAARWEKEYLKSLKKADPKDLMSAVYDYAMICLIALSLVPLTFETDNMAFQWIDGILSRFS